MTPPTLHGVARPLLALALTSACTATGGDHLTRRLAEPGDGPRILCVTAHPDDEIAFAGTLYKTSTLLDGRCDVAVVTNGEGGFKYATLAEPLYDLALTDESVGRAHLPAIRRDELLAGCALLGVHQVTFLGERDHRYTQDVAEVLGPDADVWDVDAVVETLRDVLTRGRHDFVLVLAPTPSTHGHHKAAAILAQRAVQGLPPDERPAVLCVRGQSADEPAPTYAALPGYAETAPVPGARFAFDRTQRFGHRDQLDYRIVANWAIAEHKTQGTMQLLAGRGAVEHYFLLAGGPPDAAVRARALFDALRAPQFEPRRYDDSAGTNAGGRP